MRSSLGKVRGHALFEWRAYVGDIARSLSETVSGESELPRSDLVSVSMSAAQRIWYQYDREWRQLLSSWKTDTAPLPSR